MKQHTAVDTETAFARTRMGKISAGYVQETGPICRVMRTALVSIIRYHATYRDGEAAHKEIPVLRSVLRVNSVAAGIRYDDDSSRCVIVARDEPDSCTQLSLPREGHDRNVTHIWSRRRGYPSARIRPADRQLGKAWLP